MNNNYTYGYIDGWNAENGYIDFQRSIMDSYNAQYQKLEGLRNEIQQVEASRIRNYGISEDDIRGWYNEDVVLNNGRQSYETFRSNILRERENALNSSRITGRGNEIIGLNAEVENKANEYAANLYYMIEVKAATKDIVRRRRLEIQSLLDEQRIQRERVWLERRRVGVQYDENRNILNSEQLNEFRRIEDQIWLETRRLEHALRELDEMDSVLELTAEEARIDRIGLNPEQREYYDKIDKTSMPSLESNESNKEKTYIPTPEFENNNESKNDEGSDTDEESRDEDEEEYENDELDQKQSEFDMELDKYNEAFDIYEKHLEEYKENLEKLYKLQNAYENGKIKYSEYSEFANFVKEDYNEILEEYNKIKEMYDRLKELLEELNTLDALTLEELTNRLKQLEADFNAEYQFRVYNQNGLEENENDFISDYNKAKKKIEDAINRKKEKYSNLSDEELNRMLEQLEAEFNREYQFRAHNQNGLEENEDDFIGEYNRKKKEIEDELKRRNKKYTLREPEAPEKTIIIPEKTKGEVEEQKKSNHLDLDYIIGKVRGRGYTYNKFDGFIYKYKGIKVWNWHKFNGRTYADKPFKFVKSSIAAVAFGLSKFFSNKVYNNATELRERIDQMVLNVENLTPEEIDFIIKKYKGNIEVEMYGAVPNVVFDALVTRIRKRKSELINSGNIVLQHLYNELISKYEKCKEIKQMLLNPNLSPEERTNLQQQFNQLSGELLQIITKLENTYDEINDLSAEKDYDRTTAKENRFGGRNSGVKDDHYVVDFMGDLGRSLVDARNQENGFDAAEMFLYKHKVKIENTIYKRTLKNRGAESNVGVYEWRPFVESIDYTHHNYWGDTIRTIAIVMSVANSINQAKMEDEINDLIAQQNAEIEMLNRKLLDLQKEMTKYTSDPEAYAQSYAQYLEVQAGMYQASADYFGSTAEAGMKGLHSPSMNSKGLMYGQVDKLGHTNGPKWVNEIRAIKNNSGLSAEQKITALQQVGEKINIGAGELADITRVEALKHIAKRANDFDFTASEAFLNGAASVDPNFLGGALGDIYKIALKVNSIQTLKLMEEIDITNITATVTQLAAIAGVAAIDDYFKDEKNLKVDSVKEMKEKLKEKIMLTEIPEHKLAKQAAEKALEEWDSKGFFYKLFHKKEKPREVDFEQEEYDRRRGL